jgi:peptide/nickel transport system substrate-binding protein
MEPSNGRTKNFSVILESNLNRRALLRRSVGAGLAVPSVTWLLAACGGSSSTKAPTAAASTSSGTASSGQGASTSTTAAAAATPGTTSFTIEPAAHEGGQLIFGVAGDAQTMNPILSHDSQSNYNIDLIFSGIVQIDPSTAIPIADLAKSWEISQDQITYSFVLSDGVKFQDGQPFSADDVKFTYDLILNKDANSPRYTQVSDRVKSVDVQDATHFTVTLNRPNAAFLASNMSYGIMPKHIVQDVQPAQLAQNEFSTGKKGVTIGTGPFMFEEWIQNDHITLSKYPGYWQGEPHLDKWTFRVVPNQPVLTQQLKTGEVDYGVIQPADVDSMQKQSDIAIHIYSTFSETFWCYQLDPAKPTVVQDKAVRQALLYALDREAIIDAVLFGYASVAIGTIPPISWAYNPDGITLKYPYDVEKAKSLLDQAGWKPGSDGIRVKDGQRLSFTILSSTLNSAWQQYITVFQQSWKKIGVDAKSNLIEWSAFLTKISQEKNFDMFFEGFGWGVDPDQSTWYDTASYDGGLNRGKYSNPQVDKLLADALATTDHAKRKQIYTEMQNIVMDDLPYVATDFAKTIYGVNKRVHNYFPNAINTRFDAHQWWVSS